MPHYLFRASYSQDGLRGLLKEGAAWRLGVMQTLIQSLGGRMESCYWAFGADDIYLIAELPDNAAAAAAATTVGAAGAGSISTTVLLTASEIDEARGRRGAYRAPGIWPADWHAAAAVTDNVTWPLEAWPARPMPWGGPDAPIHR